MKSPHLIRILLIIGIVALSLLLWYRHRSSDEPTMAHPRPSQRVPETPQAAAHLPRPNDDRIAPPPLKRGNRVFYGALPEGVKDIQSLPMANRPTREWRRRLETQLKKLGGDQLKSLDISPQESYVIPDGSAGRYVERVVVKISGKKGEFTSFFAEVDSETGHVLKSWGAAIPEKSRHQN